MRAYYLRPGSRSPLGAVRHRRYVRCMESISLTPVHPSPLDVIPAKSPGGSDLRRRPRRKTYEEAEATLADVRADPLE